MITGDKKMDKNVGFLVAGMAGIVLFVFGIMSYGSVMWFCGAVLFFFSLLFLLARVMKILETNMKNMQRIADELERLRVSFDSFQKK